MSGCSSQQQAEQESLPVFGTSSPGLTPAPGAGGAWPHGTGVLRDWGPCSLGEGFGSWEKCIYGSCCNRGVRRAGNWGAGAHAATPGVYITTGSPGSAGSAGALQGSKECQHSPARAELGAASPLSKAHLIPQAWQRGIGQLWLAWDHSDPALLLCQKWHHLITLLPVRLAAWGGSSMALKCVGR